MAWRAELTSPIEKFLSSTSITVSVVYYDTPNTAVILHHKTFSFKAAATGEEMQAEIVREGRAARAAKARADSLAATRPVGTTIDIP